ncbi:DUF916 domain-containing protein [Herbiconiux moechotypicola]|uniref:DUF916 domain-containing protein n=1 Tax=Herbiconiux moechotypicola TaxID=637393 RepID=A0ABN3E449_9MICO|nr:DUF916 domain-containing protein [Herbiconiux moechotypicola]MCS5731571.1 DUF916 domain-containing protein [Herbiconiux moechotypicola]
MTPHRPRRTLLAAATFVAAALVALPTLLGTAAAPASAETDVTWGVRTGDGDCGVQRENYAYVVDPGAELDDAIVVTNHDSAPLELDLYAADGFTTTSGQLDVGGRDDAASGVGAWIDLASDHLVLEPGQSQEVPFHLEVPDGLAPGDYAGGIVSSLPQPELEQGISVDRRLGIRVLVRVGGDLTAGLSVTDVSLEYSGGFDPFAAGTATVAYTVTNTGNVQLSGGQTVTVAGPFGLFPVVAGELGTIPDLLPGESWQVEAEVDGVLPLVWVTATAAVIPVVAADAGLDSAEFDPVEGGAGGWAVPWTLFVVLLLVAVAVVLLAVVRPRVRRARALREQARVDEAVAAALLEQEKLEQEKRDVQPETV